MDQDHLSALIAKTAVLMEQFERRCDEIERHQAALSQDLQHLAQQVPAVVRQSADQSLRALPGEVAGRLQQPVQDYERRLHHAGEELTSGAQELTRQLVRLQHLHRHLVWKTAGITAACLLLLFAGGAWLSGHYYGVIRDNQLAAELLQAYNRADVRLCSDGRLCANVNREARGQGPRGDYLPVKPR
jgi:hypothetical protein